MKIVSQIKVTSGKRNNVVLKKNQNKTGTAPKPINTMMQTPQHVEKAFGEQERTNFMA